MPEPETVYETLQYRLDSAGVATIALDQPETRNALSEELLAELEAALLIARDDPAVRVVVLASTHATVFSSGGDLSEFGADTPLIERYLGTERFPRIFGLLGELGKPSICAASGHVLAGALGLALACDLIVAKDTARFGTPELAVGLFPFMVMALAYGTCRARRRPSCCCSASRSPRTRQSGSGSSTASSPPTSSWPPWTTGRQGSPQSRR